MKIGIIGLGNVGGALGKRWAQLGHEIYFGSRHPADSKTKNLVAEAGPSAKVGSIPEAVSESEVVLLATPWDSARDAITSAGDLSGKILIDATNPLLPQLDGLQLGNTTSGGEMVAQWAPTARVVKAFNTVGANIMAETKFPNGKPALFYCSDDAQAKKVVAGLAGELGFDALDAGPISQSRLLEPFALLWISLALKYGYGRDIAFELLRRN